MDLHRVNLLSQTDAITISGAHSGISTHEKLIPRSRNYMIFHAHANTYSPCQLPPLYSRQPIRQISQQPTIRYTFNVFRGRVKNSLASPPHNLKIRQPGLPPRRDPHLPARPNLPKTNRERNNPSAHFN